MDTSAITNALNIWLEKNGFDTQVTGTNSDWYWYWEDNHIEYSLVCVANNLVAWNALLEELNCKYVIDPFFSCFLHELGHAQTYPSFDDDIIDEDEEIKQLMQENPASFAEDLDNIYFHLPMEIVATKWAVDFINTHPNEVRNLISAVSPLIQDFYKLNKIA